MVFNTGSTRMGKQKKNSVIVFNHVGLIKLLYVMVTVMFG